MTNGTLSSSNNPGYDLTGRGFLPTLPQSEVLKYEVKLRRRPVTSCNFEKSKIGKFDVGIIIWYNETTLLPESAYAIKHDLVEELCHKERAHITAKICRKNGIEFTELLKQYW